MLLSDDFTINFKGDTWVLRRNVLVGGEADEYNCKLQCLVDDACEFTTSLNIW